MTKKTPITAGIMGEELYTASVSVVSSDGVVDALNLNFSELVDFDKSNHILGALCRSIGIQTAQ